MYDQTNPKHIIAVRRSLSRIRLNFGRQALLVLANLRNGDIYRRLAAGLQVGVVTVYRYVHEAVDLLAARAPTLTTALWQLVRWG